MTPKDRTNPGSLFAPGSIVLFLKISTVMDSTCVTEISSLFLSLVGYDTGFCWETYLQITATKAVPIEAFFKVSVSFYWLLFE